MKKLVYYCGILLIFFIAFFFRVGGLSHDLDLGNVYHPDTPKQMWAADEFMHERYFHETGNRDLDGYPYFSSLITAKVTDKLANIVDSWREYTGSTTEKFEETPNVLFWVARYINVLFSALAVVVLFLIARSIYGSFVAWISALFLTLSPVDIAACHYASGDTAAAFFALLALAFTIRIYQKGRWFDYILGSAFCICSFSAKYHGALTALPLLLAHIFRNPHPKQLFGAKSLLQGLLVIVTAIATFFVTTAGAMQEPVKTVMQIIGFMQYTANFHLSQEVMKMGLIGRFIYSMKLNLPVFVDLLGPLLFAFSFVGLFSPIVSRKRRDWLIVSLPLVYILWGLTSKPASHPVYHALVIPQLILIGSYMIGRLMSAKRYAPYTRIAGIIIIAGAAAYLLNYACREIFFFKNRDTRVIAQRWVKENIPHNFRIAGSRYSCVTDSIDTTKGPFSGIAWVRSDFRELPEAGDPKLMSIDMGYEDMVFRNFPTEVYLGKTPLISEKHAMPIFQWIPSEFDTPMILADAKTFYRNTHIINVKEYARRTIYAKERLKNVLVVAKSLPYSTRVKVKLANRKQVWHLKDNQVSWAMFDKLRPNLPHLRDGYAYNVEMFSGKERPAQVCLGITPLEKGVLFYQLGEYEQATKWLNKTSEIKRNPTLQAMAIISGRLTHSIDPKTLKYSPFGARQTITKNNMMDLYGITTDYLNALPYIEISPQNIRYKKKQFKTLSEPLVEHDIALYTRASSNEVRSISTDFIALDEGGYTVELKCRAQNDHKVSKPLICNLLDSDGKIVATSQAVATGVTPLEYTTIKFSIDKPRNPQAIKLQLLLPPQLEISIAGLVIRPDIIASIKKLKARLVESK